MIFQPTNRGFLLCTGAYAVFRNLTLILSLCCLFHQKVSAQSNHEELALAVIYAEGPPFYVFDENTQRSSGLFIDILQHLAQSLDRDLRYLPTARNKIEQDVLEQKADVAFLAPKWLDSPEKLLFSDPVFSYQHAFYGLNAPQEDDKLADTVHGKSVCLRENYRYPELDPWLKNGMLSPVYVSSHSRLFDMLQLARCDLIYTNTYRARWTLNANHYDKAVFQLGTMGLTDEIMLAFSPRWTDKIPQVNAIIEQMRQSGEIQDVIDKNLNQQRAE